MTSPYYCIKLRTGETLFAELSEFSNNTTLALVEPFLITYTHDDGHDILTGSPWIPYTDNSEVKIPVSIAYYVGELNSNYIKYYGSVVLQHKISEIKMDVSRRMEDRNDYYVMMEGIERIKAVSNELSEKFGFPNEITTKEFEEAAEKYKPRFH